MLYKLVKSAQFQFDMFCDSTLTDKDGDFIDESILMEKLNNLKNIFNDWHQ